MQIRTTGEASSAFADEVLAHRPALMAFARKLARSDQDAEDLVQESLFRALRSEPQFQPGTNLKSWLFTILRNRFNTAYVKGRRQVAMNPEIMGNILSTPATQVTDLWIAETLQRLFDDLSPPHRAALILIPVLGLSYEEAAEVCGCTVGTMKSRLNRARAALRHQDGTENAPGEGVGPAPGPAEPGW